MWLAGGDKKYVVGDAISVADILAVCELEQPSMAGYDVARYNNDDNANQCASLLYTSMDPMCLSLKLHYFLSPFQQINKFYAS